MRSTIMLGALAAACVAGPACAYEFHLQFTPVAGARGLVVAGYAFKLGKVAGDCSYYTVRSGSGRDPRSYITHFYQNCTWDLHGNLLAVAAGEPAAPPPLSSVNGLTIYARDYKGDTTGTDTSLPGGFVNSKAAQYAWQNPSGGYVFLPNQQKVDVALTINSIGDLPLVVRRVTPSALYARVAVKSTTCIAAPVAPGASCSVVITYDPSAIPGGDNPYTAYDRLTVAVGSNSAQAPTFSETIEVPIAPGD